MDIDCFGFQCVSDGYCLAVITANQFDIVVTTSRLAETQRNISWNTKYFLAGGDACGNYVDGVDGFDGAGKDDVIGLAIEQA